MTHALAAAPGGPRPEPWYLDQPAENGTPGIGIIDVPDTGHGFIDGLLTSVKWAAPITYGFPDSTFDYQLGYPSDQLQGFSCLNAAQMAATHQILNTADWNDAGPGHAGFSVEGFTDLQIDFAGAGHGFSTIRLGNNTHTETAYAGYPGTGIDRGDVMFGGAGRNPVAGNYDYLTVMHEIGHAIGLKHGHEYLGPRPPLPVEYDAMEYSVMTYKSYFGAPTAGGYSNEKWGYAQTFMMLDIAALQYMYGADFTTNAGNTVYTWSPTTGATYVDGNLAIAPGSNRIFQTIWDGGGFDTYDLSNYATNLEINLNPGYHSTFSSVQLAHLGGGLKGIYARGNVYNALQYAGDARSLIENAKGGSGNDHIVGNVAGNVIEGNGGDDRLIGGGGSDILLGGGGDDRVNGGAGVDLINGGAGNDRLVGGAGPDVLVGGRGADVFVFDKATDSSPGAADICMSDGSAPAFQGAGVAGGDLIDLSGIDANTTQPGNQAFVFGGTGIGRVSVVNSGSDTLVRCNIDNDAAFEFELLIEDGSVRASAYKAIDFVL